MPSRSAKYIRFKSESSLSRANDSLYASQDTQLLHNEVVGVVGVVGLEISFFEYNFDLQITCIAYPAMKAKDWRTSVISENQSSDGEERLCAQVCLEYFSIIRFIVT
ncbi:hypothetical protein LOD99_4821 [Oopsacas minuta]|uniref:Uncharacterized protein n=1 Tax=Oopsacas minuta TaxID=111878 RepID=A0AAV7JT63_9METZ|nr:hypothetical protein LOD99_4821 [Oopsacas minuta]